MTVASNSYRSYNYHIRIRATASAPDALRWCLERFNGVDDSRWRLFGMDCFAFKESNDAIWFSLKFG